jgi:hypothetical protein
VQLRDPFEDQVGDHRSETHRRLVQHQQPRRGRDAAANRQHLLFAA